jgi:hypothetical protein
MLHTLALRCSDAPALFMQGVKRMVTFSGASIAQVKLPNYDGDGDSSIGVWAQKHVAGSASVDSLALPLLTEDYLLASARNV